MSANYKINHIEEDQEKLSKQEIINCLGSRKKEGCDCEDKIQRTGTINQVFQYAVNFMVAITWNM